MIIKCVLWCFKCSLIKCNCFEEKQSLIEHIIAVYKRHWYAVACQFLLTIINRYKIYILQADKLYDKNNNHHHNTTPIRIILTYTFSFDALFIMCIFFYHRRPFYLSSLCWFHFHGKNLFWFHSLIPCRKSTDIHIRTGK